MRKSNLTASVSSFVVLSLLIGLCGLSAQAQTAPISDKKDTEVQARTSAAAQEKTQTDADDASITEVTITLKKKPKVVSEYTRFRSGSASSCAFFTQGGAEQDAISDYLSSMGVGVDQDGSANIGISSPNGDALMNGSVNQNADDTFSTNSPFGDASRNIPVTTPANQSSNTPEQGDVGCVQSDKNFAAGRAHIARKDTTLTEAYAFFDDQKYPEALAMFETSWNKMGYPEAGLYIGKMYLEGLGTKSDPAKAIMWFKRVAEARAEPDSHPFNPKEPAKANEMADAIMTLAKIYLVGYGVPKDANEAYRWIKRGDYIGYVPATHNMADFIYAGIGVTEDKAQARKFYKKAATLGYAPSQFALAQMMSRGEGGPEDSSMAIGWYEAAAAQNHVGALYALAEIFDFGEGAAINQQRALYYYKEAALRNHPGAQNAIGTYFYEGHILPKDDTAARQWFELAAENHNSEAMFNMGVLCMKGEGGPVDLTKAWVWFKLAAVLGHENAPAALKALETKMSPDQKAGALKLLNGS